MNLVKAIILFLGTLYVGTLEHCIDIASIKIYNHQNIFFGKNYRCAYTAYSLITV